MAGLVSCALQAVPRIGLAAALLVAASHSLQNATAEGETRSLTLHHMHTGESISITYKRDGRYDDAALQKLNWFLRDWRKEQQIRMDPHLLDIIWEVYREVGAKESVEVVCGFRSPETNSMLRHRSRSSGVAQFSQHMLGRAMDFYIPGVPLEQIRYAGLRLQRGGVGFYPTSGSPFVHLDTGNVRHWPRMTHEQLARVFPDGKTVHVPSDGHPLARYAQALAEVEKRGSSPSAMSLAEAKAAGVADAGGLGSFAEKAKRGLSKLFGLREADEDADAEVAANDGRPVAGRSPSSGSPAVQVKPQLTSVIPVPPIRPRQASQYMTASIQTSPADSLASVVSARGIWGPVQTSAAADNTQGAVVAGNTNSQSAPGAVGTRGHHFVWFSGRQAGSAGAAADQSPARSVAVADAAPQSTGSLGPWSKPAETDRAPASLALAYAAPGPAPEARPMPMGLSRDPAPVRAAQPPPPPQPSAVVSHSQARPQTERGNDPWLRGVIMSPSVHDAMSVSTFGPTDYRALQPLLHKPHSVVAMAFTTDDPHAGMGNDAFAGSAVAFIHSVTFVPACTAELN